MHIIQGKTDHIPQAEAEIDLKMEGIKTGAAGEGGEMNV